MLAIVVSRRGPAKRGPVLERWTCAGQLPTTVQYILDYQPEGFVFGSWYQGVQSMVIWLCCLGLVG